MRTSSPSRYTFTNGASSPPERSWPSSGGKRVDEVVDHVGDGVAARLELARASDLGAQRGRDADRRHQPSTGALQNST